MHKTKRSTIARGVSMANAVKELRTQPVDSCAPSSSIANRKTFSNVATNIKVLGSSNKNSTNCTTMGTSKTSMTRRSTSKRISSTFNVNQLKKTPVYPTKSKIRKSMDVKPLNRRTIVAGDGAASKTSGSTNTFAKPNNASDKFRCSACEMTFFFKTSRDAHEKSHASTNTCQYCQRSFAIPKALSKHLRENCTKISIAERKKLLDEDEKSSDFNRTVRTPTVRTPKLRCVGLLDFVYKSCTPAQLDRLKSMPEKNYPPIKGIRHTPRKLICCYSCGEKFKDPVEYATHAGQCVASRVGNGGN